MWRPARPAWESNAVPEPGPVLVYLAEDALPLVRQRVDGMARHRGLSLPQVEIHVITAPTLRLDRQPHRKQLFETAQRLGPRLLLLDPLVRLHGIDENHAGVAELQNHKPPALPEQVLVLLADGAVLTRGKLRELLGVKNERLGQTLESLERAGRLRRTPAGWQRAE